jgi:hypothetical protein
MTKWPKSLKVFSDFVLPYFPRHSCLIKKYLDKNLKIKLSRWREGKTSDDYYQLLQDDNINKIIATDTIYWTYRIFLCLKFNFRFNYFYVFFFYLILMVFYYFNFFLSHGPTNWKSWKQALGPLCGSGRVWWEMKNCILSLALSGQIFWLPQFLIFWLW